MYRFGRSIGVFASRLCPETMAYHRHCVCSPLFSGTPHSETVGPNGSFYTTSTIRKAAHEVSQLAFQRQFKLHVHFQKHRIHIRCHVKGSLLRWTIPEIVFQGMLFHPPQPVKVLMTDASLQGWGAHLAGLTTHGLLTQDGQCLHISCLELKAVIQAIRYFHQLLTGQSLAIQCDKTTVVSYIKKQGGTISRSLCHMVMELWNLCILNNILLVETHVPGTQNTITDSLSREGSSFHEWSLNNQFLMPIFQQ